MISLWTACVDVSFSRFCCLLPRLVACFSSSCCPNACSRYRFQAELYLVELKRSCDVVLFIWYSVLCSLLIAAALSVRFVSVRFVCFPFLCCFLLPDSQPDRADQSRPDQSIALTDHTSTRLMSSSPVHKAHHVHQQPHINPLTSIKQQPQTGGSSFSQYAQKQDEGLIRAGGDKTGLGEGQMGSMQTEIQAQQEGRGKKSRQNGQVEWQDRISDRPFQQQQLSVLPQLSPFRLLRVFVLFTVSLCVSLFFCV